MGAPITPPAAGVATTALFAVAGGLSWYFADRLTEPPVDLPRVVRPEDRVRVAEARPGRVRLIGPGSDRPGVWGLAWTGGYGQIHEPVPGPTGARRFVPLQSGLPGRVEAVLDPFAFPPDPAASKLPWRLDLYPAPLGDTPVWTFPAGGDAAAILVHGRQARWHEGLRLVPLLHRAGLTALLPAYRNDPDGPRSPDGRSHLGDTEWRDLEAVVRFALDRGARRVVLVGFSMGGALVARLLRASPLAGAVRGVVLEAPVLDWKPVIARAAADRGVPRWAARTLLPVAMTLASLRVGIDWDALDQRHAPLPVPTLLIHGDADPVVPVEVSDAIAAAHPGVITYERVTGVGHVAAWNRDPDRYEQVVTAWLSGLGVTV